MLEEEGERDRDRIRFDGEVGGIELEVVRRDLEQGQGQGSSGVELGLGKGERIGEIEGIGEEDAGEERKRRGGCMGS